MCKGSLEIDGKFVAELDNGICAFIPLDELENPSTVKDLYLTLSADMTLEKVFTKFNICMYQNKTVLEVTLLILILVDKVVDLGSRVK